MSRSAAILLLSALLIGGCQSDEFGQRRPPSPEMQRQYNLAFQEMLAQPGNPEVTFKYATAATEVGDLEGAIGALEGLLLVDPNLPRVQLQLGILYYRLKSYEVARSYLESALKSPDLAPDVRKLAERLVSRIPSQSRSRRA